MLLVRGDARRVEAHLTMPGSGMPWPGPGTDASGGEAGVMAVAVSRTEFTGGRSPSPSEARGAVAPCATGGAPKPRCDAWSGLTWAASGAGASCPPVGRAALAMQPACWPPASWRGSVKAAAVAPNREAGVAVASLGCAADGRRKDDHGSAPGCSSLLGLRVSFGVAAVPKGLFECFPVSGTPNVLGFGVKGDCPGMLPMSSRRRSPSRGLQPVVALAGPRVGPQGPLHTSWNFANERIPTWRSRFLPCSC